MTIFAEAASCLEQAVNIYCEIGRLTTAARYYKVLGYSFKLVSCIFIIWLHLQCGGYVLNRFFISFNLRVRGLVNCFVPWQEIAEYYESEQNIEQAIAYFEKAAEFFQTEEVTTSAHRCKLKIAQYAAQLEQ